MASTVRPYSSARSAVMRAPPLRVASTTTTASAKPAMMRLRTGNASRRGADAVAELADEQSRVAHAVEQCAMATRVHDVEAGAEHTDHRSAGLERALVRGGVDADGEPTHHRDVSPGEDRTQFACVGEPVRRGGAGPHHGHAPAGERVGCIAFGEQHRGSIGKVVDRVAQATFDVDTSSSLRQQARNPLGRRQLLPDPRQRLPTGEVGGGARSQSTADASPRSSPANAPTGPPPRSTSERSRVGVMFGRHARVAAATSTGSGCGWPFTARLPAAARRSRGGRR